MPYGFEASYHDYTLFHIIRKSRPYSGKHIFDKTISMDIVSSYFRLTAPIMTMTLAVFAGSKDLPEARRDDTERFIEGFFTDARDQIERVVYGGGTSGVMGQVRRACERLAIPIVGYSLERYRRAGDATKNIEYFASTPDRLTAFARAGGFLALPGGMGTIGEICAMNDAIKAAKDARRILVPRCFMALSHILESLVTDDMLADEDRGNFVMLPETGPYRLG